jgi:hypothetical protein
MAETAIAPAPAPAPADDSQFTDAQLADGTKLRFKGQLTPDQVKAKVTEFRAKQGTPAPATSTTPAAPAAATTQQPKSWLDRAKDVSETIRDNSLKTIADPLYPVSKLLGAASDWAQKRSDAAQQSDLSQIAKTGTNPNPVTAYTPAAGYDLLARATKVGSGLTSPQGVGTAAATALAPEIAGPALVAHGLWNAAKNAPKAIEGNPDAVEASLSGLSEAAGGGAATASVAGGAPTPARRMMSAAKEATGNTMSETAAETPRPAGKIQPALNNAPREVLEHAKQEGIDLTPGQATEQPIAQRLQAAGERGIIGTKPLTEALEANRSKFGDAVNRLSERVDPKRMGLSEESAGEAVKQAAQTAKDVAHENATDGYKQIEWMKKAPVDPSTISQKWMDLRESLPMGVEDQIISQVPRNMRAQVEELLSPTGMKAPLTMEQGIALRSFFREMGETEGLPGRLEGAYRQMMKATDSAMEASATKAGGAKEWRDANAGWRDYAQKYGDKQSPLYKILRQGDPAKITRALMNNGSAADIETLRNEGMSSAIEPLQRQVIQDIARNKFTVGRDGLGGYSDSFLKTLFGEPGAKELYLKADIARRLNWNVNPSGTSDVMMTGEQLGKPSKILSLMGAAKLSMPREATSFLPRDTTGSAAKLLTAARKSGSYTPSEKAATMSADRPSLGKEFDSGEAAHELERNKGIVRNPKATDEERSVAQQRISEATVQAVPPDWEYLGKNSMGINEFKQKGSNISISVLDKDMDPAKVNARIAAKLKEFKN